MRLDIHNRELVKENLAIVFDKHTYNNKVDRWFAQIIISRERDRYKLSGMFYDATSIIQERVNKYGNVYRSSYEGTVLSSYRKHLANKLTYKPPDHYDR